MTINFDVKSFFKTEKNGDVAFLFFSMANFIEHLVKAHNELEDKIVDIRQDAVACDAIYTKRISQLEEEIDVLRRGATIMKPGEARVTPGLNPTGDTAGWEVSQNPSQTIQFGNSLDTTKQMKEDIRAFVELIERPINFEAGDYSLGHKHQRMGIANDPRFKNLKRHCDG